MGWFFNFFFLELEYGKGQSRLTYVCSLVFVLLNRLEGSEYIVQIEEATEPRKERSSVLKQWQMEVTCKILQFGIAVWFPHSSIYLTSDMLIESNSWDV